MRSVIRTFITIPLLTFGVCTVGCDDPFVEGIDFECSPSRDIECESGFVCVDNWCHRLCDYFRECEPNEACIDIQK